MNQQAVEVATGQRFEVGKNWARFLETLDDAKMVEAMQSLRDMLETTIAFILPTTIRNRWLAQPS
jgi:hypothetical protein